MHGAKANTSFESIRLIVFILQPTSGLACCVLIFRSCTASFRNWSSTILFVNTTWVVQPSDANWNCFVFITNGLDHYKTCFVNSLKIDHIGLYQKGRGQQLPTTCNHKSYFKVVSAKSCQIQSKIARSQERIWTKSNDYVTTYRIHVFWC